MKVRLLKTIFFSALSTVIAFSAVTYTSCTPDKCKAIVCANNGVCSSGACICQSGYEGAQCDAITRNKFEGNWQVSETSSLTFVHTNYELHINDDPGNITNVLIGNFHNYYAAVSGYTHGDTLYIPVQSFSINKSTIQGVGYLTQQNDIYGQHSQMLVHYTVTDDSTGTIDDYGVNNPGVSVWNK